MAFLPLFFLIAVTDGLWFAGELGVEPLRVAARWLDHMPLLNLVLFLALLVVALPFFPGWIARLLGAKPLADGPLRRRLEAGAQAIDLRVGRILMWPTQRRILNAMVIGVTPRSRTIILSDRLIAELPEDELMAVFFHEAGHAKLHHLVLYLVMFVTLIGLVHAAHDDLLMAGISPGWILILELALFWFVILGTVSRRFEREADIYGADHAAVLDPEQLSMAPGMAAPVPRGAALMMRALDRVRQATGGRVPSHRHGTLDDRIAYIGEYATDDQERARFSRTRRVMRVGIVAAFAVGVVGVVKKWPVELRRAEAGIEIENGNEAVARADATSTDDRTTARAHWAQAYRAYRRAAEKIGEETKHPGDAAQVAQLQRQAADIALDELNELGKARAGFEAAERTLKRLSEEPAIDDAALAPVRFLTWVGSARVAARGNRPDVAQDYLARATRAEAQLSVLARGSGPDLRTWYEEVLRLATAAVEGHAARAAGAAGVDALTLARRRLEQMAGGSNPALRWKGLRNAAQRELDALR